MGLLEASSVPLALLCEPIPSDPARNKDLAVSLSNLAFALRELNQYYDAAVADKEAVDLWKEIVEQDLSTQTKLVFLSVVCVDLRELGRHSDAVADAEKEVAGIFKAIAKPDSTMWPTTLLLLSSVNCVGWSDTASRRLPKESVQAVFGRLPDMTPSLETTSPSPSTISPRICAPARSVQQGS